MISEGRESIWLSLKSLPRSITNGLTEHSSISVLCDEYLQYCSDVREMSPVTIKTRKTLLKGFVEYFNSREIVHLDSLTLPILDEFFTHYSKTHNPTTVNNVRRLIKVFIRWLEGYKEIQIKIRPEAILLVRVVDKTPKFLDDYIVRRVINQCEDYQDKLVIALLREAGLRISELTHIKVDDVSHGQVKIMGKGMIERYVHITPFLSNELLQFALDNGRGRNSWLFQNKFGRTGGKLKVTTIRVRIQKCFLRYGGIKMYPHQLRHTMAIELLRAGCDLVTIQTQLGHQDMKTTQVYLRIDNKFSRDAYRKAMPKSYLQA